MKKRTFTTEKADLNMQEIEAILRKTGGATVAQIVFDLGVSGTTVSNYLNHMQEAGRVRKKTNPERKSKHMRFGPELWEIGRDPSVLPSTGSRVRATEQKKIINLDPLIHALFPWMRP